MLVVVATGGRYDTWKFNGLWAVGDEDGMGCWRWTQPYGDHAEGER